MEITVKYNVFGLDEEDGQEMTMEISDRLYDRLESYEDDGELLDEDFLSTELPGLHKKILQAIHDDIEDRELDYHKEKRMEEGALPFIQEEKEVLESDLPEDFFNCSDDDFEYEIEL